MRSPCSFFKCHKKFLMVTSFFFYQLQHIDHSIRNAELKEGKVRWEAEIVFDKLYDVLRFIYHTCSKFT